MKHFKSMAIKYDISLMIQKRLLTKTVPVNNFFLTGAVIVHNWLLKGTVHINNFFLDLIFFWIFHCWPHKWILWAKKLLLDYEGLEHVFWIPLTTKPGHWTSPFNLTLNRDFEPLHRVCSTIEPIKILRHMLPQYMALVW